MALTLAPAVEPTTVGLLALVISAAVWDIYTRRIPNSLITFGVITSFVLLSQAHGLLGISEWISGGALLLALFVIPYAYGILGAGDVKLMGAIGSFLGPSAALWNGLMCMLGGGLLCLMVMFFLPWGRTLQRIPYGLSIALSTLIFMSFRTGLT
jgi:prepilin peptidase CpaA